jgi:hypothetical protein
VTTMTTCLESGIGGHYVHDGDRKVLNLFVWVLYSLRFVLFVSGSCNLVVASTLFLSFLVTGKEIRWDFVRHWHRIFLCSLINREKDEG